MPLRQPKFCRLSPEDRSVVAGPTESVRVQGSSATILRHAFYILYKQPEPFRIVQDALKTYIDLCISLCIQAESVGATEPGGPKIQSRYSGVITGIMHLGSHGRKASHTKLLSIRYSSGIAM